MWVSLILTLVVLLLLFVLSMIWPPDSPWAPWWRTKDHEIRQALKLAKVSKKDTIFDLGSGDGRVLIVAAKEFGAHGIGIEIDPLRFIISKLAVRISRISDKVKIIRGNFFKQDLSSATVVFAYLVPKALERLKPKLLKELRLGTKIITLKYEISLKKIDEDKKNKLFLYEL